MRQVPSFRLCSLHILSFTFLFSGWRRTGAYIWDHSSRCHQDWASAQPWLVNPRWAPLTKGENGRWQEPGHHFENPQGLRGWLGRGHTAGWRRRRGGRRSYVRHWRRKCAVFFHYTSYMQWVFLRIFSAIPPTDSPKFWVRWRFCWVRQKNYLS